MNEDLCDHDNCMSCPIQRDLRKVDREIREYEEWRLRHRAKMYLRAAEKIAQMSR